MSKKKSGPPLTPEDEDLWKQVTQDDKPLASRGKLAAQKAKLPERRVFVKERPPEAPIAFEALPELSAGGYDGVDRNTKERFRRGEYPIEGRLDLHGKTRVEAETLVTDFIHNHYRRGSRFLLVITGKGIRKPGDDPERGVLRDMLPGWLSHESLRPYVVAFDKAQIRHGGSGAFYILLRRKR